MIKGRKTAEYWHMPGFFFFFKSRYFQLSVLLAAHQVRFQSSRSTREFLTCSPGPAESSKAQGWELVCLNKSQRTVKGSPTASAPHRDPNVFPHSLSQRGSSLHSKSNPTLLPKSLEHMYGFGTLHRSHNCGSDSGRWPRGEHCIVP